MPKVEIREFGSGRGDEFDQTTEIDVDSKGIELFEAEDPPKLQAIGQKTVELTFNQGRKLNALVTKNGQLVTSPVYLDQGESVNMQPWRARAGTYEIPEAKITHLRNGSK